VINFSTSHLIVYWLAAQYVDPAYSLYINFLILLKVITTAKDNIKKANNNKIRL
jgi:Co/Zn/Cd efflux system component